MSALSTGYLCDGEDCAEFYRGPTWPSALAQKTFSAAAETGWQKTGTPRDDTEHKHLCPACARAA